MLLIVKGCRITVTAVMSHASVGNRLIINGFSLFIIRGFFEGKLNLLPYTGQRSLAAI
jgi:hypothetical protein